MRSAAVLPVMLLAWLVVGCSHPAQPTPTLDPGELLALLHERQQGDSRYFVEVDLGRFRVTHPLSSGEGHLYVQFHLIGIVPEDKRVHLEEVWPRFEKRVRDAIITLVQRTETAHLADPSLTFFKEEVVGTVNRVLQERLLADVAFSDFSTDREPGTPWSVPVSEGKSGGDHGKSGGHGGH
ncbi:MAG: hypothetical protein K6T59_10155 [Bryobacteraceae bacterium]|nr:hypothetical protein [Bryobacteraceae bacterium]